MREEFKPLSVEELKTQMSVADRVFKMITNAEDQKTVFGFMLDVQEAIDAKIRINQ